ncbi:MAG: nucleotidyl transferase AbiEii/AbiGii toxin family protein [Candidatus Omnitrophota bacterium]|nr:nucleotidyl transferase AbiEii/AbiGii toxin family protein [Candidatus Omnitrophota bacterium]
MDKFVLLTRKDKRAYFEVAAANLNIMPQLIEKDFWVCWILKIIFSLPKVGAHLTFKGGTSLSKCYNVIKRFSEDIDISIERPFLSKTHAIEPDKEKSNKENQKRLKELQLVCKTKIDEMIIPSLKQSIAAVLSDTGEWKIEPDSGDEDGQTVLFIFPHAMTSTAESYVRSSVKIEFGARSDHWPVETATIVPYVANVSGERVIEGASARVLAAERTFWEKATILHMIYHYPSEKNIPPRMSRHYYDIYAMADSPIYKKALKSISLLKHVSDHKSLFFKANWAHYDTAKSGTLRLVPRDNLVSQLKNDYRQMQQMFFEEPPSFEQIIEKLRAIEEQINRISL